jgi:hypothetical protein
MGRRARRVLAVVAAIAIPFAAPAIASAIGFSAAIGSAAANTITGAVLGAGVAKASGGDPLIGAITGGAGGYFGGGGGDLFAGPTPAATTASTASSITPSLTAGTTYDAFGSVVPSVTPTVTPVASPSLAVAPVASSMGDISQGISYYGMEPTSVAGFGAPAAAAPTFTPQPVAADLGSQLSNTAPTAAASPMGDISQGISYYGMEPTPIASTAPTAVASGYTYDMFGNVVPAGGEAGGAVAGVQPGGNLISSREILPATVASTAGQPTTFMEALRQVPAEIANAYKDPKTLAQLTLQAAGALASSALAGKGISPEEQYLLDAQREELEWLRNNNPEAYELKLQEAQKLLGMSDYFDPEYFGLQRARAAQIKGARAKRAGLRGMTGQSRAVAERQLDIATGRETGTAYDVGAQSALQGRIQTQQAGLQFMPMPSSYTTSFGPLQNAYSAADARRRQAVRDTSELFGTITGIPQARSTG